MSANDSILDGFFMPTIETTLLNIEKASPFVPKGMVFDVYLTLEAMGRPAFVPDEQLLQDLDRSSPDYWSTRCTLAEKRQYLERLSKSAFMQALLDLGDTMKAVNVFVDHCRKAAEARAARGKAYLDSTGSADEYKGGYTTEFSPNAQVGSFDDFVQSQAALLDLTDDEIASAFAAEGWSCGFGRHSATTSPTRSLCAGIVSKAKDLPTSFPALITSLNKLKADLGLTNEVQDSDTDQPRKRLITMDDMDKVATADPADLACETFDKRVVDHSLLVRQDQEDKDQLSHTFILVDVSGSMDTNDLGGRVCRGFAANLLCLAVLNLAGKNGMKVWILPFDDSVGTIQTATNRQEAIEASRWVATLNYDGGGTDIEKAILHAYKLTSTSGEYDKADILVLTDGCSPLTQRLVNEKPQRTKLRTLIISNDVSRKDLMPLINASDKHAMLSWDTKTDTISVGDVLVGMGATK